MQLQRLRGRKICDRLIRHGNLWKGRHLYVRWLPEHPRHPAAKRDTLAVYAGTLASRKLDHSAVKRNRMRRRCREALRVAVASHAALQTTQLLLAPRSSSLKAPFAEIAKDIEHFLSTRLYARSQ